MVYGKGCLVRSCNMEPQHMMIILCVIFGLAAIFKSLHDFVFKKNYKWYNFFGVGICFTGCLISLVGIFVVV